VERERLISTDLARLGSIVAVSTKVSGMNAIS
jgi:hypothetical protein